MEGKATREDIQDIEVTDPQETQGFQFINQTGSKIKDPAIKKLVRQNAISHVSKAREQQRGRLIPIRPLVQSYTGEALGSYVGSEIAEDYHPLRGEVSQLDEYWASERNSGYPGSSPPPTTAFSPTQLLALAESTVRNDELSFGQKSSAVSPASSFYANGTKEFPRGVTQTRQRRSRFQRGCRTCRRRHVKCDEGRPACLRCLRSYGSCKGYPTDGTSIHTFDSSIPASSSGSQPSIKRLAAGPKFSNETEALYFRLFVEETSLELVGLFETSFWGRILLQESNQQDFVRHALIGIAALSKSIKTKALNVAYPGSFGAIWKDEATKQREYALTHFGKSLRGMKAVPWAGEDYLRKISIAILLVIVFEIMYGQPDMAFSHALIGDRLIRRRIDLRDRARIVYNNGQRSPAPRVLDGDIFSTFVRFGLQMMTFVDTRPYLTHELGRVNASDTMAKMPTEFFSLMEATYFWEYVIRRAIHYVMYAAVRSQSNRTMGEFSKPFPGRVVDMTPETSIYGSPYIVPPELQTDKEFHVVEINRWWSAFVPLLSQIQSSSSDLRQRTAALMMQLYAIAIRIVIEGTLFTTECSYDIFLSEFMEIVCLCRQIDENFREMSEQQPSFHVHLNIVPCLFITVLRCRGRSLRRECIEILRTSQQDGPWNRFIMAKLGSWIMELEEAGSDSDFIPEHARVQFTRGMRSMETRLVMVQCVRRDRSLGWETREPSLTWEEMAIDDDASMEWFATTGPLSGVA